MTPKLNEPAIELKTLRSFAGNSSPSNKNGMQPKPMENPIIYMTRLVSGSHLFKCIQILSLCNFRNHCNSLSKFIEFERTRNCEYPSVSNKMRLPLIPWTLPSQQPI